VDCEDLFQTSMTNGHKKLQTCYNLVVHKTTQIPNHCCFNKANIGHSQKQNQYIYSIYGSSLPFANFTFRLTIWTKYFLLSRIGLLTHVSGAWNMASACEEESKFDEKLNINEVE
jgi:hypothetical protein